MVDIFENLQGMVPDLPNFPYVWVLGAVALGIIAYVFLRYKHVAFVFEVDESGHRRLRTIDKVAMVRKRNSRYLDLLKLRKKVKNEYKPFHVGRRNVYFFLMDNEEHLHQIGFTESSIDELKKLRVIPSNVYSAQIEEIDEISREYQTQNWWDKYGRYVMDGIYILAIIAIVLFVTEAWKEVMGQASGLMQRAIELNQQTAVAK